MAFLTFSWTVDGIIFLLTIVTAAYFYMTRNFQYWKKRGVVGIPPVPFFGNFSNYCALKISLGYLYKSLYERGEDLPYVGIYILDKPCLLLRDPEIIKRVLIKDFNFFSDKFTHASKNHNISNNCLFLIDNPYWRYIRKKFTNLFTTGKLKTIFKDVQEVGKDLDYYMDSLELEGSGRVIEVKDLSAKFTTDFIGVAQFGLKLNSLRDPNAEFRKFGKKMFGTYNFRRAVELASMWLAPQITTFFDFRLFERKACDFFKTTFQGILDERQISKINRNDFIDVLIQLRENDENTDESHGFKFEGDNLLAQVMIFFAGGYDTSSTTMSFSLYELARNPDIQTKLRTEINDAIEKNNGKISYEMITNLQYLDMVVAEILRMYPPLPLLDRKAASDYKIEETGLVIEKGTPILISLLGLHYDPKYFVKPDSFDPENFSDFNKSSRNPYVYMPFGNGPRNCIGMRQGLLQSKLGLVHIISRFEVTLLKDSSLVIDPKSFFTSAKGGFFVNIRKIDAKRY